MRKPLPHGSAGCFRSRKPSAWSTATQPEQHQQVWALLDLGCREGWPSEFEWGGLRLELPRDKRARLVDAIDRLAQRYPTSIRRVEATAWLLPCPKCGKDGYGVVVV